MRWVLHGTLTAAVAEALKRHGHAACPVSELGVATDAAACDLLAAATRQQLDLITSDAALVNAIYDQDIWFKRVVVFLQLPGGEVEQDDAVDRLFARYKRLTPGRLYTMTETRAKVRQLPSRPAPNAKRRGE
jgi:hypothetical protein